MSQVITIVSHLVSYCLNLIYLLDSVTEHIGFTLALTWIPQLSTSSLHPQHNSLLAQVQLICNSYDAG
ncbi:MAG: hypothetical protein FRX48_06390 [Lasallia pustulata]|uniref:Uncharacterized protein n=1 Tax=Lasallia pustulata TaxID=136370 RepID=A0A5M8PLM3_9LECA|nr:MAG: hypothetical protein FRX48_06390 [Lasallia pustulata]